MCNACVGVALGGGLVCDVCVTRDLQVLEECAPDLDPQSVRVLLARVRAFCHAGAAPGSPAVSLAALHQALGLARLKVRATLLSHLPLWA